MTNRTPLILAVGSLVTVHVYGRERPGRVICNDKKGDRPFVVLYEDGHDNKEICQTFKADGWTSQEKFYITKAPVIRHEYQNVWTNPKATSYRYGNEEDAREVKDRYSPRLGVLKLTFTDDVLTNAELV